MLLQSFMEATVKAATIDLEAWEHRVAEAGGSLDFDVEADVHTISGRVLSYTAFGNDSFEKGQEIYHLQMQYAQLLFEASERFTFRIPGYRYVRNNHIQCLPVTFPSLNHMFSKKLIPQMIKSLVCGGNEFHTDVVMLEIILLGNVTVVPNTNWKLRIWVTTRI